MKKIILFVFLLLNINFYINALNIIIENTTEETLYLNIIEPKSLNIDDQFQINVSIDRNIETYNALESFLYSASPVFYKIDKNSISNKHLENNKDYIFVISYLYKINEEQHQFRTTFILLTKENLNIFKRHYGFTEEDSFNPVVFNISKEISGINLSASDDTGKINSNYQWLQDNVNLTINNK